MEMTFTVGERVVALWMINTMEGVGRSDGRIVVALQDALKLDTLPEGSLRAEQLKSGVEYVIERGHLVWLRDKINDLFDKNKIPPVYARYALQLSDRLAKELSDDGEEKSNA